MASLSATFAADFSAFTNACNQAEVSLKGIESGASNVERTLTRMADSLSGTKIIQQATVMAEAVERVGGVSMLTAKELERVGATAQEAAEKLRAMGQDVPPGIQRIADAARDARPQFAGLLDSVKTVAGALGIAFTAGAVIGGIKNLIAGAFDLAEAISNTSKQLGVSAEKWQGWVTAAKAGGATAEDVTTAVGKMNVNLDQASTTTVKALKALGLEFTTIRAMKPEDAFEAIVTGIMKIPDPMERARIAVELFGKGGQALLPAIVDDMAKVGAAATKLGDDSVKGLADGKQAWEDFGNKVTIVTGQMLASVLGVSELQVAVKQLTQAQKDNILAQLPATATTEDYAKALIKAARAHHDVTLATEGTGRAIHKTAEEIAAEAAALKNAQAALDAHRAAIQGLADQLSGQKVAEHVRDLAAAVELAEKHGGLAAIEEAKLADELIRLHDEGVKLPPVLQAIVDKYSILEQQTIDAKDALEAWSREVKQHAADEKKASEDIQQYFKDQAEAADAAAKAETDDWKETVRQHTQAEKEANAEVQKYLDETKKRQDEMVAYMSDALVGLFDASLRGWDAFKAELNRLWKEILHDFEEELIKKMVAKWMAGLAEMAAGSAAGGGFWAGLLNFLGLGGGGNGSGGGNQPAPSPPGAGGGPPDLGAPTPPGGQPPAYPPDFIGPIPPPPVIGVPPNVPPGVEPGGPGKPTPKPVSRGGRVIPGGIDYLDAGGVVWPWQPQGSDTVPAMLTPGERVLSVADAKRYDAGAGRARRGTGGTVIIELNGRLLAQVVVPELEGEVRRLGFGR